MDKIGRKIIIDLWITNDNELDFVCTRRNNWIIFFDKNKNQFIRFWKKEDLEKEYKNHQLFLKYNFNVADILFSIEKDEYFLYIEKNLWVDVIWKQILENQISYDEWFMDIHNLAEKYFWAQKNTINKNWCINEIKFSNQLDLLSSECLLWGFIDKLLLEKLFIKINNDLEEVKFYELTHWDFNTRNIFKLWVIDIEDSYNWTIWYDLISLISHNYWFPLDWKWRKIIFSYAKWDILKLITLYENKTWMDLKSNFNLSFILRWIWACVWMSDMPDEQVYRYKRLNKYIEKYLNWDNLLNEFLDEVEYVNKIIWDWKK